MYSYRCSNSGTQHGGLIIQYALYGVQQHFPNFPDHLYVQDVVTFDTPFGGITSNSITFGQPIFGIEDNIQVEQMQQDSTFMNEMQSNAAQNPQGAGPGTDWTMMGSIEYENSSESSTYPCDELLEISDQIDVATFMQGGHKSLYDTGCYSHGGMLLDENTNGNSEDVWNAIYYWCDGCSQSPSGPEGPFNDPNNAWTIDTIAPQPFFHMLYALYLPTW